MMMMLLTSWIGFFDFWIKKDGDGQEEGEDQLEICLL